MPGEAEGQRCGASLQIMRDASTGTAAAFAHSFRRRTQEWSRAALRWPDMFPFTLIAAIVVASLAWNAHVGLRWEPTLPLSTLVTVTLAFSIIAAMFSTAWSNRTIVELATYYCLWFNFSYFGVRLNYLAATLDFPLQDKLFARADLALGFDWLAWSSIAFSHPVVADILALAYRSMYVQCLVVVVILALWGARGRNREFLTSAIFAYLLTIAVATVLPSFGPRSILALTSPWDPVLHALRAGIDTPLPYAGIVSFPSYHASMAFLLAMAMRDNRSGFVVASLLNSLMLLSAIPMGGHFLVDVIAGCAIGAVSHYAVRGG